MYEVKFSCIDRVFHINPVLAEFSIGNIPITINWYGFLIAIGFVLAVIWGLHVAKKWHIDVDKFINVILVSAVSGIIGARLYYVVFNWEEFKGTGFVEKIAIWNGGLAIYGGIIFAMIGAYIMCKVNKINFLNAADIAAMGFPIGQAIGRWGNFTNQEAFGSNTTLPWGMYSESTSFFGFGTREYLEWEQEALLKKGITVDPSMPVHPTFLYESIWCIIGFIILLIICKKYRKFSGQIALSYGIWYGIGRAIIEGFRTDSLYIWNTNIRVSQLLSAVIAVLFVAIIVIVLLRLKKHPKLIEGVDYYYPIKTMDELKEEEKQRKLEKQNKKKQNESVEK